MAAASFGPVDNFVVFWLRQLGYVVNKIQNKKYYCITIKYILQNFKRFFTNKLISNFLWHPHVKNNDIICTNAAQPTQTALDVK